jgi:hypothetical protein
MPFDVACACGHHLTGYRLAQRQILNCPQCRSPVFVLPASPWPRLPRRPAAAKSTPSGASPATSERVPAWPWLLPALAGVSALAVLGVVGLVFLLPLFPPSRDDQTASFRRLTQQATDALEHGHLSSATDCVEHARQILDSKPGGITGAEAQRLIALQRELGLINQLVNEPLENLVLHASRLPANEWVRLFNESYRGRSVILEAWLISGATAGGDRIASYQLQAGRERGWIVHSEADPTVQKDQGDRQPLLFGGRLGSLRLEAAAEGRGPIWLMRFEPGTIAEITDPAIRKLLMGTPLDRPRRIESFVDVQQLPGDEQLPALPLRAGEAKVEARLGPPRVSGRQFIQGFLLEQWTYPGEVGGLLLMAGGQLGELRVWRPGEPLSVGQNPSQNGEPFPQNPVSK